MRRWYLQWRRRRRSRVPVPPEWLAILDRRLPFFPRLRDPLRTKFLGDVRAIVEEKRFEGWGGQVITEEIRVVIAGAAARLVIGLDVSLYDHVESIVVRPQSMTSKADSGSAIGKYGGTFVALAWPAVVTGLSDPRDGHDVVAHEFAHALDHADGELDGVPPLLTAEQLRACREVLAEAFRIQRDGRGRLDRYARTSEVELFAVATEAFFEHPARLRVHAPDLYDELRRFYRIDPETLAQS